jgi:intergrase/recombinase
MADGKVSACLYISREVLEAAKEAGLNLSRVAESALAEATGRLECGGRDSDPRRPPPEDLKPAPLVDYASVREEFLRWLRQIRGLGEGSMRQKTAYLDRFARPLAGPSDVVAAFDGLGATQKRHLANGYRSLFRFYEAQGLVDRARLDALRANLPALRSGVDLNVPSEEEVIDSLRRLAEARVDGKLFAVYNLLLDSGLRVVEGIGLFNRMASGEARLEAQDGFSAAPMGEFRRTKLAYCGFVTDYTLALVQGVKETLVYDKSMETLHSKYGVLSYKYLRKFAFDAMTSERLNVPESVADFIEGRTPKTVGARHYMHLRRKALEFYPRYARYLREVRAKALSAVPKAGFEPATSGDVSRNPPFFSCLAPVLSECECKSVRERECTNVLVWHALLLMPTLAF